MTILTPIVSVITIIAYFILSIFMPILGYLVPCYKIKKVNIFGSRYRIVINLAVALILYIMNIKILLVYLAYPFMTEFLFYLTQKFAHKVKTFDRIVLMSLTSTVIIFLIIYFNRAYIENMLNEALSLANSRVFNFEPQEIYASIMFLKENILSSIFSYLFIGNIFLFLALTGANSYEKWKISCYWLVPFMLFIIASKILIININPTLQDNIIMITRYIYTWYGIKTLFSLTAKIGVKFNILRHMISIILGITYPLPVFIFGALASFEVVEVKTIKI